MLKRIISEEIEVDNTLINMGLDKLSLINATDYGAGERALCTNNDPIGFDNNIMYARTGRRLREIHCVKKSDWIRCNENNQTAIKNTERLIRIVPCNFDEFAGNILIDPTNKSPKGEVSKKNASNNGTGWLPGLPEIEIKHNNGYQNWILGFYVDEEGKIGRELSLPISFDNGYYKAFAHRIILSSRTDEQKSTSRKEYTATDAVEIVEIDIKRK